MKQHIKLCSLLFLAACAAGCGKKEKGVVDAEQPPASPESTDFDSLMKKGVNSVAQRETGTAIEVATKALELRPESAEAHLLAGQAAYQGEDFKQARENFSAIVKEMSLPSALRAKAYVGLGQVHFAEHKYDLARISFLQANWLDPQNEAALYCLGRVYSSERNYHFLVAARDLYQMFECLSERSHPGNSRAKRVREKIIPELSREIAAQKEPNTGNATKAAQLVQEARLLREKKQLTAAKKKYDEARKTDPQSYYAALGYAELVRETEKTSEGVKKAIEAYMKASFLKPGLPENYLEAARLARTNNFSIQAAEIMNRAIAHHPQNREVLDQLIAALQKNGQKDLSDAWDEYRKALKRR